MSKPLVSVIVPTHNDGPTIDKCVRSLLQQSWHPLEIIVIDDASTDETGSILAALAQEHSSLRVLRLERKSGAARARNHGFAEARGEYLALIDGDMWAPEKWIEQLLEPILEGVADVTGGPDFVPPDAPLESRCIGYSMDSILTNGGLRRGDTTLVTYLPGTGNMAIRADFVARSGGFDEGFHDTGEDKEWLYRVRDAGARFLYLPHALAWHERRPDVWLHAKKQLLSGRRRFDIWTKDPTSFEWAHLAPSLLILFLVVSGAVSGLRPLWYLVLFSGMAVVALDCLKGARELGSPRAFFVLVFTSCVIPFGYGLGIWWRALEWIVERATGRR